MKLGNISIKIFHNKNSWSKKKNTLLLLIMKLAITHSNRKPLKIRNHHFSNYELLFIFMICIKFKFILCIRTILIDIYIFFHIKISSPGL